MSKKDDFEFLNSPIWIKYTQETYKTPDEIKYRLEQANSSVNNWQEAHTEIIRFRKIGAVPLFLNSIKKNFWFYPSDSIIKKAHDIEKMGIALYDKVYKESTFANEFKLDSTIEEAITSAIYEGANSTRAKAQELLETQSTPKNKDEWMLVNNYQALLWIKENYTSSITIDTINQIHHIVTKNTLTNDDANYSGKLRNDKVYIYSSNNELKHEGIEHTKLESALNEALDLVTKNKRYFPALLKGILIHYFVSYIHPYFDGNGRTARTLFYLNSIKNNLNFVELLSLSAYLKHHGKQYEKSFEKVVKNNFDITYFIDFNLNALEDALKKVEIKINFLFKINSLEKKLNLSIQQIGLLQKLALHKFRTYDIESYAKSIQKSREIARQELKQLTDLELLEEIKVGKKFTYKINKKNLLKIMNE